MSMMQEMLADMLKKSLPPEVMELLTPEKIKEFGERANAFISDLRSGLDRIEAGQKETLARLENLERIVADDRRNCSKRPGKQPGSNGDASSSDR